MAAPGPKKTSAAVRIAKHTVASTSGCILWTASVSTQGGYPMLLDDDGNLTYAYRVAYELVHGKGTLDGLDCHHICRLRTCMNVDHMEGLTAEEHAAVHAAEREAHNVNCSPRIRNLSRQGRDRRDIKAQTNVPLYFIDALIAADRKLMNSAVAA